MGYKKVGQVDLYKKTPNGWLVLIVIGVVVYLLASGKCS
jgi:hypothetical protein